MKLQLLMESWGSSLDIRSAWVTFQPDRAYPLSGLIMDEFFLKEEGERERDWWRLADRWINRKNERERENRQTESKKGREINKDK